MATDDGDRYVGKSILDGQFEILARIGAGGMGTVYRANQPEMNRQVAVKILHPKLLDRKDVAARFRREARTLSHLTHPNTVRVLLFGELDDGAIYIVMEFLEGKNLNQVHRTQGPLSLPRALSIMEQACGALHEAHVAGIIHRDLKPENIFITEQGGIRDFVKVLDYGLARVTQRQMQPGSVKLTQEGMVFGTPEFMSPEQAQGLPLTAASDVYSLGIILFEIITGKLPFDAKSPMQFLQKQVMAAPMTLGERAPDREFPDDLERAIEKCLRKDPTKRFATAAEFGEELGRIRATLVGPTSVLPRTPDLALEVPGLVATYAKESAKEVVAKDASTQTAQPAAAPSERPGTHTEPLKARSQPPAAEGKGPTGTVPIEARPARGKASSDAPDKDYARTPAVGGKDADQDADKGAAPIAAKETNYTPIIIAFVLGLVVAGVAMFLMRK
jgi:eukaryotic-like serine/threonine-protein kinase